MNRAATMLKRLLGDDRRSRLRLAEHNARAWRSSELVRLRVRSQRGVWTVDDGTITIAIAAHRRWVRYRLGIDEGCRALGSLYRVGNEIALNDGDAVIDIGANIGEVAMHCAAQGAVVHAIEPDPVAFRLLEMDTSGIAGNHTCQLAISENSGRVRFFLGTTNADSSMVEPEHYAAPTMVHASRLDDVASELGIGKVRLLKCDAEGAEPEVLRGAGEVLRRTEWVSFDCGPERRGEATVDECRDILTSCGFDVSVFSEDRVRRIVLGHQAQLSAGGSAAAG